VPAYYQSLHRMLLPASSKTLAILKLGCAIILGIVTFAPLNFVLSKNRLNSVYRTKSCHHFIYLYFVFYILYFAFCICISICCCILNPEL
jgi:hypothetical protein